MSKEEHFLDLFNQLDTYLRVKHFNNRSSYMSYVRKLFYIKKHKLDSIISKEYHFDTLRTAGEIRNILAHKNDIIVPSDEFLSRFEKLVERITKAKSVYQIMTHYRDLQTIDYMDHLSIALSLMKDHGFASLPVLHDNQWVGMFTERTVFDYLSLHNHIDDKMLVKQFHEVIDLDDDPRAYFKFITRNMIVDDAYQLFMEDFKSKHNLILLLVTENGKPKEKLLGIVALRDLKNELF